MKQKLKLRVLPSRYRPRFLGELDKRTEIYQRLVAAYQRIIRDMGGDLKSGDLKHISHTKLALAERFVWLEAMIQQIEIKMAQDSNTSPELVSRWIQAVNGLTGLARTIGLDPVPTAMPGGLKAYVEKKA